MGLFGNSNSSATKKKLKETNINATVSTKKEKKIIVYGRPSVMRNCFEIVADCLSIISCICSFFIKT